MKMRSGVMIISAFLLFSLIGVFSVSAEENNTNSTQTCTDSDGGINYNFKGTATSGSLVENDECSFDSKSLSEWSCNSAGNLSQSIYSCPNGCKNGACITGTTPVPEPTCTDSDGGVDYNVKGTTTANNSLTEFKEVVREDYCFYYADYGSGSTVMKVNEQQHGRLEEWYCDGKSFGSKEYVCPDWCKDGACVQKPIVCPAMPTCTGAKDTGQKDSDGCPIYSCQATPTQTCTDSDGGKDIYTQGTVKDQYASETDYCTPLAVAAGQQTSVMEFYCDSEKRTSTVMDCPSKKCSNGACIKGEPVTEKITCKFENTKTEQKCYLAGQFSDADLGTKYCIAAAGSGSCVIAYTGYKGEQVTWKSSCGNLATTTQDGTDEVVYFKCESGETTTEKIKNKGFTNVYFQCYDGAESKSTDRAACKSAEYWKKFASNFCAAHCENDPKKCKQKYENQEDIDKCLGKCGINSFSLGNECYLGEGLCKKEESTNDCCSRWAKENNIVTPACAGGWKIDDGKCSYSCKVEENVTETITEPVLVCKDSCPLDGKCYDFGYRKSGKYCSDDGGFVEQKKNEACDNNFECASNVCVNSKCIDEGFLQKIMNWFKKLFSGGK